MCDSVAKTRSDLDLCGDTKSDPYSSSFTWASRSEMYRRGKANFLSQAKYRHLLPNVLRRIQEIRKDATDLCCGSDQNCRANMNRVKVSICKPSTDPNAPDPCVFGGRFDMSAENYTALFREVFRVYDSQGDSDLRQIAARYLTSNEIKGLASQSKPLPLSSGHITLTSYFSEREGIQSLDPILQHEFGHACSMIKMQTHALSGENPQNRERARRAVFWLDRVRERCSVDAELPEAYSDFWQSLGESPDLAKCLFRLTDLNRENKLDRPCQGLCPGHYLEEGVGIAFSLLIGDLSGRAESVFPGSCGHVRDAQHPMVADVVECLTEHSPRFRSRLNAVYRCG